MRLYDYIYTFIIYKHIMKKISLSLCFTLHVIYLYPHMGERKRRGEKRRVWEGRGKERRGRTSFLLTLLITFASFASYTLGPIPSVENILPPDVNMVCTLISFRFFFLAQVAFYRETLLIIQSKLITTFPIFLYPLTWCVFLHSTYHLLIHFLFAFTSFSP